MLHRYFEFKDIKICQSGDFILQGTSNIEGGSATRREINYIDTDGSEYADILYTKRSFEISGFINAEYEEQMVSLKRKLISKCSLKEKFRLYYFNRMQKYSAECYFDKLPTFSERIGWKLPFKLYITIPSFYWQTGDIIKPILYGRENMLTDTFILPMVFTRRYSEASVTNEGDVEVFPKFIVTCEEAFESGGIVITNHTSGKVIEINHQSVPGEVVTVDCQMKMVKSNMNGEITDKITLDTVFFAIGQGESLLSAESQGNVVTLEFRENFLGV